MRTALHLVVQFLGHLFGRFGTQTQRRHLFLVTQVFAYELLIEPVERVDLPHETLHGRAQRPQFPFVFLDFGIVPAALFFEPVEQRIGHMPLLHQGHVHGVVVHFQIAHLAQQHRQSVGQGILIDHQLRILGFLSLNLPPEQERDGRQNNQQDDDGDFQPFDRTAAFLLRVVVVIVIVFVIFHNLCF